MLESYDPGVGTKLSPAVKPVHLIDIFSVIAVILHDMTVSVFMRISLLSASAAENVSRHFLKDMFHKVSHN